MQFGTTHSHIGPISLLLSALASFVLMGTLVGGCSARHRGALTAQDIAEHGTTTLAGSKESVFQACVVALQMGGYAIQMAEPASGLVVTRPRRIGGEEAGEAGRIRHHGYVVEVDGVGEGRVRVTATPTAGDGRDAPLPTWNLAQERAAWERLFADVRSLVDRDREETH